MRFSPRLKSSIMPESSYSSFSYSFKEVKPAKEDLDDFLQLHLVEEDHPALLFIENTLPELQQLANIRGSYRIMDVEVLNIADGILIVEGKTLQIGIQVAGYLKGSEQIAVFVATAGPELTDMADHFSADGELLEAYLIDAIGSLTVEKAMDNIQESLELSSKEEGLSCTNRYSPGYCNWPLVDQHTLFSLIPDHTSGVILTESALMLPRKSVSGVIGIGKKVRHRDYGCATCNNQTCIYRKILSA